MGICMEQPVILVVGAGPTGLFFAHQMMSLGHRVRLIDRKPGLSTTSRAIGLHVRTQEILGRLGMLEDFTKMALPGNMEVHFGNHHIVIDFHQVPTPWPHMLFISQADIEKILYQHLTSVGGEVEWGTEYVHRNEDTCTLRHSDGRVETITPQWVIGADGGHSIIRQESHIAFPGQGFEQGFFLADVRGSIDVSDHTFHIYWEQDGGIVICQLPDGIYRLLFILRDESDQELDQLTPQALLAMVHKRTDHVKEIQEVIWKSKFQIRTCLAETWRHHQCFIMGDAAHVHSPVGGQGLNMCVQDAWNLSWKLDLALHHVAASELLDSYEIERKAIVSKILKTTEFGTRVLCASPWVQKGAKTLMAWVQRIPQVRHFMPNIISQVQGHFSGTRWVSQPKGDRRWKGPKPGYRWPYITTQGGSSFDLWNPKRHVIIVFSEHNEIAHRLRPIASWIEIRVVHDPALRSTLHAGSGSIYVIRPDGYIGYRSRELDTDHMMDYFQSIFDRYLWKSTAAATMKSHK